jgi:signal transduction histidine kinase
MNFNLINNIEGCHALISQAPLNLIYYSHIPTAIVALLIGFFVFFKNKYSLISKILLSISITFSLWSLFDMLQWTNGYDSISTMFTWALLGVLYGLIFLFSVYFASVFIMKKDVSILNKIIWLLLLLPIIILTPTTINLTSFDAVNCEASEGQYFTYYYYFLGALSFLWILIYSIIGYRKTEKDFKKQILLMTMGIELFLLSFFTSGFFASLFDNYELLVYGLFGMAIFMGFLAYLIVQYKAFDIKLLGAQALVIALVILIGSQFLFIKTFTNQVLTGITLAISAGFGWMLIKSVKTEVARKEELQIMTNRLAQANDQLRKLDNAKSEFISIASHQLRTPLTAIKGFISLLLEGSYGKVNSIHREVMNKVYLSNERLIALVEDMLNLSRIESGRMEYNFEKVKIEDVAKEVYDTFAIRSREKGLKLELKLPETPLPEATTDRNKIREVISNLVDNSIKYTLKGWVSIRLSQKDDKIIVAITDTGIGIPQDELPYLFEKFSRGKDISRLNTGGTGLGLHVGKRMIEALHGAIRVESDGEGKGSTFYIEVPIKLEEEK